MAKNTPKRSSTLDEQFIRLELLRVHVEGGSVTRRAKIVIAKEMDSSQKLVERQFKAMDDAGVFANGDSMYDTTQAAIACGVKQRMMSRYCQEGRVGRRVGKGEQSRFAIEPADLLAFLNDHLTATWSEVITRIRDRRLLDMLTAAQWRKMEAKLRLAECDSACLAMRLRCAREETGEVTAETRHTLRATGKSVGYAHEHVRKWQFVAQRIAAEILNEKGE